MNEAQLTVLVTGASGLLGRQLVKQFADTAYSVIAIGRQPCPEELKANCQWQQIDITDSKALNSKVDILIHAAPLWLLPDFFKQLSALNKVERCIAFSSTSAESKIEAKDTQDRELAGKLLNAEAKLKRLCDLKANYTILRPTMIYGYGKDTNISVIARFIKKHGFFPLAGEATGLRQPVHVDDLVDAVVNVIENKNTFGKIYSLTGGETLTYKNMVERIFSGLNKRNRIISLPVFAYRLLLKLNNNGYSGGTADRMSQNLSYDSVEAVTDFNYQPQMFLTNPQRDLSGI